MTEPAPFDPAVLRAAISAAVSSLTDAAAQDEAVAEFRDDRRVLGIRRPPAMVPLGRAWRLGVFLLGRDETLRNVGATTRAVQPPHSALYAESAERRRQYQAAAFRGRFAPGETVNFGTTVIDLNALTDAGPLIMRGGMPLVRWNLSAPDDSGMPFADYLAERVALLAHPPAGA